MSPAQTNLVRVSAYRRDRNIMDELAKFVADKTGLSVDQAKSAAGAVVEYLKGKVPAPVGSAIDSVLGSGTGAVSGVAGAADAAKGALGGLFGKK